MSRHKVVLYNPQAVFYTMPLALVAVGSALDRQKYEVQIIDGRLERDPAAAVLSAADGALCLGITVLSGAPIRDALHITRVVKARYPALPVVWGGWHPSLIPEETLHEPGIDGVVLGQGEATFRELAGRLAQGDRPDGLPGTCWRKNGQVTLGPPRPAVDLNGLAAHAYDLIPVEDYFTVKGRRQLDYVSSVGCRYRCAFCADPLVHGRHWAGLEPSRVARELTALWQEYRFDDVSFQDEAFFTDRERAIALADELLRLGVRATWTATIRPDQGARLPDEMMALCARSGLRRVVVGAESGAQEILDRIMKDTQVEQIVATAEKCARHGIGAALSFIVGFPGETDASVRATLDVIKRLRAIGPDIETSIFFYKPYPGSALAGELKQQGVELPRTLDTWANFDYVTSSGPWVSAQKRRLVERFQFYSRFAWDRASWPRRPLQRIARWRCERDEYRLPVEKFVVERLRPEQRLA